MTSIIPFVLGLIVAAGILLPVLGRLRAAMTEERQRDESLERELAHLRRLHGRIEQEQQFLTNFLRDFPYLARDLYTGVKERTVPAILLDVVSRSFKPERGVVLVRRGKAETDPGRESRLVVAAVAPEDSPIRVGTEFPMDQGELGFVAEAQLVMNRHDLVSETAVSRMKPRAENIPALEVDLVAPMVFDRETLGLIALSGLRRMSEDAKAALGLIAQTGAQALHNAAAYSQLKVTAELDGLTGVFNKRHLTHTLTEMIYKTACEAYDRRERESADGTPMWTRPPSLAIFLFDLDHFKNYNDLNGHVAGDRLLQELARLVQENIRKEDVFGRFGGEEFLLILPNTTLSHALAAAYKLRTLLSAHPFAFADRQPLGVVSVSGGVAEYPSDALDANGLLKAADEALYEAKRQGRNRVLAATRDYAGNGGANGGSGGPVLAAAKTEAARS